MQAVVILQQILPKIANTFRENVSKRPEALVQPVAALPCEKHLGSAVEVLRELSVLLDLLLNPDVHLTVKARNYPTAVIWILFCQTGLVRLVFASWRAKSLQGVQEWMESGASSW